MCHSVVGFHIRCCSPCSFCSSTASARIPTTLWSIIRLTSHPRCCTLLGVEPVFCSFYISIVFLCSGLMLSYLSICFTCFIIYSSTRYEYLFLLLFYFISIPISIPIFMPVLVCWWILLWCSCLWIDCVLCGVWACPWWLSKRVCPWWGSSTTFPWVCPACVCSSWWLGHWPCLPDRRGDGVVWNRVLSWIRKRVPAWSEHPWW